MAAVVYNESVHCPYCTTYTGTKNSHLRYHLNTKHAEAEKVNRKRDSAGNLCVFPSATMGHCPTCNLYLDPGVTLETSTHRSTSLHVWRQSLGLSSLSAMQSSSSATESGTHQASREGLSDDDDPPGYEGGNGEGSDESENFNLSSRRDAESVHPAATAVPIWQCAYYTSDWFDGRDDLLDTTVDPLIGSVWSAPFDYQEYSPRDDFSVKIVDPLNSGRYRVVFVRFAHPDSGEEDVSDET